MKRRILILLFASVATAATLAAEEKSLGGHPVCEPSTALRIQCPNGSGDCILVGDNEVRDQLFLFEVKGGELERKTRPALNLKKISDIEAFAALEGDGILVLGSHSRNKRCEARENRRRFAVGRVTPGGFETTSRVKTEAKVRGGILFGGVPTDPLRKAIHDRINQTEDKADEIKKTEQACMAIHPPFNIEGAAYIESGPGKGAWVGLRSPLLAWGADEKEHAILLRMKSFEKFHFDDAVLLDLNGWGVRELIVRDQSLWGIAGPAPDGEAVFRLWRIELSKLKPGTVAKPKFFDDIELPSSSEGLAIVGAHAYVTIDGDGNDEVCIVPGRYTKVPLPH